MKKEMYKLELIWWNARKDIVLCSTFTMALLIVRELFVYQDLTDIIIYDLQGNYQVLKDNGNATHYYQNLIRE